MDKATQTNMQLPVLLSPSVAAGQRSDLDVTDAPKRQPLAMASSSTLAKLGHTPLTAQAAELADRTANIATEIHHVHSPNQPCIA
jgi:hypothetical protein